MNTYVGATEMYVRNVHSLACMARLARVHRHRKIQQPDLEI